MLKIKIPTNVIDLARTGPFVKVGTRNTWLNLKYNYLNHFEIIVGHFKY